MESKDSRTSSSSSSVLDWAGPHTVEIPRAPQTDFGFTLRHLVVHPPQSVLGEGRDDLGPNSKESRSYLSRGISLEPQETIFVKSVKEASPAHHAGLNIGDRILAVNGEPISDKSYRDVITAIHQSTQNLKLLVVPKDEDILQMAYQSQARDCMFTSSSTSLSDHVRLSGVSDTHHHSHSSSDIVHGTLDKSFGYNSNDNLPYGRQEVRHSYPLSQWGHSSEEFRLEDFSPTTNQSQAHTGELLMTDSCRNHEVAEKKFHSQPDSVPQTSESSMTSNITYSIPSRSKYSFGLYFPSKSSTTMPEGGVSGSDTISSESLGREYKEPLDQSGLTKSQTFDVSQKRPSTGYRKVSLDDNSALSSSARSREFFIRYSSDKAASDNRNRYSPRYSTFERYSNDNRPTYIISRSQTVSTLSPSSSSGDGKVLRNSSDYVTPTQNTSNTSRSCQYIPVISEKQQHPRNAETIEKRSDLSGYSQNLLCSEKTDLGTGSKTFVLSIPCGQQTEQQSRLTGPNYIPVRQRFGTTFALTRSPTAAHIEIQRSIGKPLVSQLKCQFESGRKENTPPPVIDGQSQYKTEIEKIKTQPKFSSIAMRKASFEQSPDRDLPGYEESCDQEGHSSTVYLDPSMETAQPTVKVRKVTTDRYSTGSLQKFEGNFEKTGIIGRNQDTTSIRIFVSPDSASTPIQTRESFSRPILIESGQSLGKNVMKSSKDGYYHSPSNSVCSTDNNSDVGMRESSSGTGLVDSGVWIKSYHSSSDMLDGADEVCVTADSGATSDREGSGGQRSEQTHKTYLSAVNTPIQRSSTSSLSSASSGGTPGSSVTPAVMTLSDSSVTVSHGNGVCDVQAPAESANVSVVVRKKTQESLEDQANKLHRRTSYLMATARDRTNVVPLEETFSTSQDLLSQKPQQGGGTARRNSSVKLNKFFGEMIPSIAEGVEMKHSDYDETPEIIRKGSLSCKISAIEGKKCSDRTWKPVYAVLRPSELFITRDKEGGSSSSSFEDLHIPLKSCTVEFARDYAKKKKNVFRLTTYNDCDYLFQTEDRGMMMCWIQGIKSINETDKMEKEEVTASEKEKQVQSTIEINIIPSSKTSPQLGHKGKKLSALSFKSKLSASPNMKRKKSNAADKDKEEGLKKGWKDRIPMMKSLKKHNDDSNLLSVEQEVNSHKFQFGVPLEYCFPSPHNEFVPLIVELCTRIVEARGLEVVGVYRVPGNSAAVTALTEEFNRGIDSVNIDNEKLLDINVISSLLKSFFRKLPEPLIPTNMYEEFIEANRYPDEDKRKLKIKRLLHLLPPHHNETLKHMAEHLNKVASYGNINKMDAKNLAIMFGPTLVRKKGDDTVSLVTDMSDQCRIVESIILHHEWFFSPWDQDSYIPMETTVETVPVEEGQNLSKDDDEEADSAISTKEIISSIVGAASKKLRQQQQKSLDSLDMVDSSSTTSASTFRDRNMSDAGYLASFAKSMSSISSSLGASEEYLGRKSSMPSTRYLESNKSGHNISIRSDIMDLEFADASSPSSSGFSGLMSDDCVQDKNDELEISHGLPTSLSRDAINKLKRIGEDVSSLLQTFEQKHQKEREQRRQEQEKVEREHFRTKLELEQEENNSVEDWLAWESGLPSLGIPGGVSGSYFGDTNPFGQKSHSVSASGDNKGGQDKKKVQQKNKLTAEPTTQTGTKVASVSPQIARLVPDTTQQCRMCRGGSHENILSHSKNQDVEKSIVTRKASQQVQESQQKPTLLNVGGLIHRPASFRNSLGRRHGSLDSLIDMIDKQEKRISWASTDSEDGSDLLTSITTTFDQKLEILLNPKYKLTGTSKKSSKHEATGTDDSTNEAAIDWDSISQVKNLQPKPSVNPKQVYTVASLIDSDRSFRDPSLHRSSRSDPKIGIASRFERSDISRTTSSSPLVTTSLGTATILGQQHKYQQFNAETLLDKPSLHPQDPTHKLSQATQSENGLTTNISVQEKEEKKTELGKSEKVLNLPPLRDDSLFQNKVPDAKSVKGEKVPNAESVKGEAIKARIASKRNMNRRHTIGGLGDFLHSKILSQLRGETRSKTCSAFGYILPALQPIISDLVTVGSSHNRECVGNVKLRGSTPDLLCPQ